VLGAGRTCGAGWDEERAERPCGGCRWRVRAAEGTDAKERGSTGRVGCGTAGWDRSGWTGRAGGVGGM
jgi:hypothetical protein